MRTIWDISPPVSDRSPVFPGDTAYQQRWTATLDTHCPVNVAEIRLSTHLGAHADAPLHYDPHGPSAGHMALEPFLGPCRVIHARHGRPLIEPADLLPHLSNCPPRILVSTTAKAKYDAWSDHFTAFAPSSLQLLADQGIQLVGIDTPSVDPACSKTLESHQVLRHHAMRVLENLVLDEIAPGDYELIALPLALIQADASPVRAILRSLD